MSIHIVVVENKEDWKPEFPNVQIVTVKNYLAQQGDFAFIKNTKVINLCRNYRYLSLGYYCSLLAEARYHKVIPTVRTLRDLSSRAIYSLDIDSLDALLQKSLEKDLVCEVTNTLEAYILFGRCDKPVLKKLAQQIFATFRCPLLKVEFRHQGKWQISSIKPMYLNTLPSDQMGLFIDALNHYTRKRWSDAKAKQLFRYDLAILYDPHEQFAPSNSQAINKFIEIGEELGIDVDLIKKKDYPRLAEYDALFIRETTHIDHHTYRFAKKAESEGMVVIDDPNSILRCTNKVYLAELLKANNIPTPKTLILQKNGGFQYLENEIPYPVVLKIPDGSFCRGVHKARDYNELMDIAIQLFKESDIIIAQEYIYTPFDWRIGILNRKAIFACQYFMSDQHWQITQHNVPTGVRPIEGGSRTFPIEEVPKKVVKTALKAAKQIGNGLYGVDLKHTENGIFVIEVNDNPSIENQIEDSVLEDDLYRIILKEFIRRIDKKLSSKKLHRSC